jgi:putative component of toxin-antitoxin plasmid stabilization module
VDVREYLTADGRNPYREWLDTLDVTPRPRIQARVLRFSTGNLGDHKSVGGGVGEARIMFGPGTASTSPRMVRNSCSCCSVATSPQTANVARAQESWKAYQEDKRRGKTK